MLVDMRKACQFFADVLFESSAVPSSKFLNFLVAVPQEGESICSSASQQVCINPVDRDTLVRGIIE